MEINDKIRQLRNKRKFSQRFVAEELGIDLSNYSKMEAGKTKITIDRLKAIAKILDVRIEDLLSLNKTYHEVDLYTLIKENKKMLEELIIEIKGTQKLILTQNKQL